MSSAIVSAASGSRLWVNHQEKGSESRYGFAACMHEIRTENHPLNIWYKCTISAFGQYAPSFLPINPHPAHLVSHGATILHVVQLYSTVAQSDKYCLDCTVLYACCALIIYVFGQSTHYLQVCPSLKSQVSSLKSQVSLDCPSLKSQVSSICLFFLFFFSFHDMYSCVYCTW